MGELAATGGREQSLQECESLSSPLRSARATLNDPLRFADVIYTTAGVPGSFLGAYLVETSLGRIKTLAISTLATSLGTLVFVLVDSQPGIMLSGMLVSLAATLMCELWRCHDAEFRS